MDVRVGPERSLRVEELMFWTIILEKTLESPFNCKEINPVYPKGNKPWIYIGKSDAEAETPILWQPIGRAYSLESTLMLGIIEDRKRRWQRMRCLDGITDLVDMSLSWRIGKPDILQFIGSQRVRHDWVTEKQQQRNFSRQETTKEGKDFQIINSN